MRPGLLGALFLVALVQSFSEARTVSRCELKKELGKLLVLPPELERLKEKILSRVICQLEKETQLNTEMLQVLEPTSRSAKELTGKPTKGHRQKRDVEFFEDEMRKLQEEVDAMKPVTQDATNIQEREDSTKQLSKALNDQSSSDTKVIDKLDQDEVNPEHDTSLTFEELTRILTNSKDNEEQNKGEDVQRLQEEMRVTEEEVERRVVDKLDRDEVDALAETHDSKDTSLIFEELEKMLTNSATGKTKTVDDARKLEEDTREVGVEKRVINKLDRDEVDTSEDKDSNLTLEDEDYLEINEKHREDSDKEKDARVIDELDHDELELEVSPDKEDTHGENSAEDEERKLMNSMDQGETVEDTQEDVEREPEVEEGGEQKLKDMSMTAEDQTSMEVVDVPADDMSSTKGESEEAEGTTTNNVDGDKMDVVQEDIGDTEEDADWDEDTSSLKGRLTNFTFEELVKILAEKMKALEDDVVKDERTPRMETPGDEKEASEREQELMRHLNQVEMKSGEDTTMELVGQDKMDTGEDKNTRSTMDKEEVMTINKLDQDERNPEEDMDKNVVLKEAVRSLIKELEQDKRNTSNMEAISRTLAKLRSIINKMDEEQRDTGEVTPKDKQDMSLKMEMVRENPNKANTEVESITNQDHLLDMVGELEKRFLTVQDDNDTLLDKDLEEQPSILDDLLSDLDPMTEPGEEDMTNGSRRKRSLSRGRRPLRLFGLLQLSDHLTCDSGFGRSRNVCNTNCTAFIDDDISDDVACFVRIKAWRFLLRPTCPTGQDIFQDCPGPAAPE